MPDPAKKIRMSDEAKTILTGVGAVICAACMFAAFEFEELPLALTLGIAFAAFDIGLIMYGLRLAAARRKSQSLLAASRAVQYLASWLFWMMAFAILVAAFVMAGYAVPAALPLIGMPIFAAIMIVALSSAAQRLRRRRAEMVLGYVEQAVRLNLPLPRMILAAADSETGTLRQRLLGLFAHLEQGEDIEHALKSSVPEMSNRMLRSVGTGQRLGRLPHALSRLVRPLSLRATPSGEIGGIVSAYPLGWFLCTLLIGVVVIPKFAKIFHDFKVELPPVTKAVIAADEFLFSGSVVGIAVGIVLLAPMGRATSRIFQASDVEPPFGGVVRDHLIWCVPIVGTLARDCGIAALCDVLASAVEAGWPLDQALREAAEGQTNAILRRRVYAWAAGITDGLTIWESARRARMPALLVGMLATVRDNDSMVTTLKFLSRHYESRHERARALLRTIWPPVAVVMMGVVVAVLALGLFEPLVALINHLAGSAHMSGGF